MYERRLTPVVTSSLRSFRATVLNGPRQSGKTTLLRQLTASKGSYVSFDDESTRAHATADPHGFVTAYPFPLAIDEIQRGGQPMVLAVKAALDESQDRGRFLLAGSTRFLTVPQISESLAGRAEILDLWPLSMGEIEGTTECFVDTAFDRPEELAVTEVRRLSRAELFTAVARGGFPEVVDLDEAQRRRWFRTYLRAVIERDIVEASAIRQRDDLPRLVRLLASNTSGELVPSRIAGDARLGDDLVRRYIGLLELVGLLQRIPAWMPSLTTREKRHPKAVLTDTGLACAVLGLDASRLALPGAPMAGALLETFVTMELVKQATWSSTVPTVRHWRDRNGAEVDIVLEGDDGRVVAIEVKASRTVSEADARHLATRRDALVDRFVVGVVLHLGDRPVPLGDRLVALPVQALWAAA